MLGKLKPLIVVILATHAFVSYAGGGESKGHVGPAKFEKIPGTDLKRVILDKKSVDRLGIELGEVSKKTVTNTQTYGGSVSLPVKKLEESKASGGAFANFGSSFAKQPEQFVTLTEPDTEYDWIRVTLSKPEWSRIDKSKPAVVKPLKTRTGTEQVATAIPSGLPPVEDTKRSMLKIHYKIPKTESSYKLNERVRVELTLTGSGESHLVVPYDSVHYDSKGKSWVYINSDQYVYERKPIDIDRIEGDFAVLNAGPPLNTAVVTVGAPLLYGAEVVFKK